MFRSLSGRFLILTIAFVMAAEVLIFVPSVASFRVDYLTLRLERAEIASMARLSESMVSDALEAELLERAGVYNVVLRRARRRELALSSALPAPVAHSYDLRSATWPELFRDALSRLFRTRDEVIRVLGRAADGQQTVEVTMSSGPLRSAMLAYGLRVLGLSLIISGISAGLLFFAVRQLMVKPVARVTRAMRRYAEAPEDARSITEPSSNIREIREAEEALYTLQTELTGALRQKERLAALGAGVAKISHDLRNILTSAQLFTDRIEGSTDPMVARLAPKLVASITRAVNLCETTLAFGRAQEPTPRLARVALADLVAEVFDSERLAAGDYALSFSEDVPSRLMLRADSEQLHRVLLNLVRNARQAIMGSGEAGEIAVKAWEDDAFWWIEVSDTGPGLPAKAREHLFQAFQGRASKDGSGLGLAIAAEIVRGHGGRLELRESGPDGTRFVIQIPKDELAGQSLKEI